MQNLNKKIGVFLLSMVFLGTSSGLVQADFVSTESALAEARVDYARADLLNTLQGDEVRNRLVAMGVDTAQVEARVAAMTADEVAQINAHLDQLPAGGDAIGIVLTLFIVFIITDAICATDIFPFVNCINTGA